MSRLTLVKFSSEECGTCHKMSFYDSKVTAELGCDFISVKLQDTNLYKQYRKILLKAYPDKAGMGWPTYLLVKDIDGEFSIEGELKGGMQKGDFRKKLALILSE